MLIVSVLLVGLAAGALARFLVPGPDPMGIFATLALGLLGACLGAVAATVISEDNDGLGLLSAVIGSVVMLLLYRAVTQRRPV
ncbi:MAG TPA: GlsB/YeaQ/YmgE family stress response membrane protein [Acidimicrobiales bacterium]|nr:GlsB/YeaQ/YmgE family stress response membrane protein [Acidimicrobiales bacterium]